MVRRLAAILAADLVGYSRLMGEDEAATLAALKARRSAILEPNFEKHRGRLVKTTGDGFLVEFASAVDAVGCALAIQQEMAAAGAGPGGAGLALRIGINLGDVAVEDGDLFGDAVNVAARLQAMAEPGGIHIAANVHDQLRGRLAVPCEDLGPLALKNIAGSVHAYRVVVPGSPAVPAAPPVAAEPAPELPSIAVLPFTNMSGEAEQAYFADGITEDLITALSRSSWFRVVARNSAFAFKEQPQDVLRSARELGVRYLLRGSVRRGAGRVRITARLLEGDSGRSLWAEHYDGVLEDVFELQDRITHAVVGAVQPAVREAEIRTARNRRPEDARAYDLVLRALPAFWEVNAAAGAGAIADLERALALDPRYALAHALLSWFYVQNVIYHLVGDAGEASRRGLWHAREAYRLDHGDATVLALLGAAEMLLAHDLDSAAVHLERALSQDPNASWVWSRRGFLKVYQGDHEGAIADFETAIRLSPLDPFNFNNLAGLGMVHFTAGRTGEAVAALERALAERPEAIWLNRLLASYAAQAGQLDRAGEAMARFLAANPHVTVSAMGRIAPWRGPALDRYLEGLRLAGMPP